MKIHQMAIFAATAAVCTTAFAGTDDIKASNNQFDIQAISTKVDYKETNDGRGGSLAGKFYTESGHIPGFSLSFSMMNDVLLDNDYLQLQYSKSDGDTDYKGVLRPTRVYGTASGQVGSTISDYSLRWGKGFAFDGAFMITPYGELGRHEQQIKSSSDATFTHNWYGVGTLAQYSPFSRLVLTANALIGRTFAADYNQNGPTAFSGALGDSNLYKVGLSTDYAFTKNFHGNVGIDYTSFKYGSSATHRAQNGEGVWMPSSQTDDTTLKIGVGYAF
ncbi:porin [Pseudomonas gingeri]|uniref:porin n=1 Tax=Pseudomonas gingeri TaxID=117681 RepID=UPI0015A2A00F|nr:porin [Pseudomonas gingeri]NWD73582.1 porin [Pseudomonas gingeri]